MAMPLSVAIVPLPHGEGGWRHISWGFSLQGLLEIAPLRCAYTLERTPRKDIAVRAEKTW